MSHQRRIDAPTLSSCLQSSLITSAIVGSGVGLHSAGVGLPFISRAAIASLKTGVGSAVFFGTCIAIYSISIF